MNLQNQLEQYFDLYFKIPIDENNELYSDILLFEKYFVFFLKNQQDIEASLKKTSFKKFCLNLLNQNKYEHLHKIINLIPNSYLYIIADLFAEFIANLDKDEAFDFIYYLYEEEEEFAKILDVIFFKESILSMLDFPIDFLLKNTIYAKKIDNYLNFKRQVLEISTSKDFYNKNFMLKKRFLDFIFLQPQTLHEFLNINNNYNKLFKVFLKIQDFIKSLNVATVILEDLNKKSLKKGDKTKYSLSYLENKVNKIIEQITNILEALSDTSNNWNFKTKYYNIINLLNYLEDLTDKFSNKKYKAIQNFIEIDFTLLLDSFKENYVFVAQSFLNLKFYVGKLTQNKKKAVILNSVLEIHEKILKYFHEFFKSLIENPYTNDNAQLKQRIGIHCREDLATAIPYIYNFILKKVFVIERDETSVKAKISEYFPEYISLMVFKIEKIYKKTDDSYENFIFYFDLLEEIAEQKINDKKNPQNPKEIKDLLRRLYLNIAKILYINHELNDFLVIGTDGFINRVMAGKEKKTNEEYINLFFSKSKLIFKKLVDSLDKTKNKVHLLRILQYFPRERLLKLVSMKNEMIKKKIKTKKLTILKYLIKQLDLEDSK
ncbi:MAG: hypothetical protein ACTSRZ_17415 [Promethearchaeota archaeon]